MPLTAWEENVDELIPGKFYMIIPTDKSYADYYIGKYLYGNTYPDNVYIFSSVLIHKANREFAYEEEMIFDEAQIERVLDAYAKIPVQKPSKIKTVRTRRHGGKKSRKHRK